MDLLEVFKELQHYMGASGWCVKGLEEYPTLNGFVQQDTGMKILPFEHIRQFGDSDYGFYGTILFHTEYVGDKGRIYLRVDYND